MNVTKSIAKYPTTPLCLQHLATFIQASLSGSASTEDWGDRQPPAVEGGVSMNLVSTWDDGDVACWLYQHVDCQGSDAVRRRAGFDYTTWRGLIEDE